MVWFQCVEWPERWCAGSFVVRCGVKGLLWTRCCRMNMNLVLVVQWAQMLWFVVQLMLARRCVKKIRLWTLMLILLVWSRV